MSSNLILPDDPEFYQPLKMGKNPELLTPKTAAKLRIEEIDKNKSKESQGNISYASSAIASHSDAWVKHGQASGLNNLMTQPMFFSPLHTNQNWQIASKRREVYMWARFFNDTEPKVAAAISIYSAFPMNGFKLECPNRKVTAFFEHNVVKRLNLEERFKEIAAEYFLLGDVFIHTDIECPVCKNTSINPENNEICNHKGGSIKRLIILNPDWIEVQQSVLADEPSIVMIPDEELKRIVFYKHPKSIYDRIPDQVKQMVIQNQPIPLSNRTVSHLKHMGVPYGTYGTSLIRRLFTTLAYKTKIMSANWIVAERLILPVRVVKVGNDNRPATSADIADIQQQLGSTANEPTLTLVTHHAFEYDFIGASGKILQVTQEMEYIGKEILDGVMLNQSLLNGEGTGSYSGASVGIEALIRRIESWRTTLANWCHENIFLPIAEMQGFIDHEKTKELGYTYYMYPRIKWRDLHLRDRSNYHQLLMQLNQSGQLSTRTLMEELDLNYDQEVKRMRHEQVSGGAAGGLGGAGGMPGGAGGMPGGAGGMPGAAGGAPLGGDPAAAAGGMPGMGGGMPGAEMAAGGGAGGGMPMGGGPTAGAGTKILKKGKGSHKDKDQQYVPPPMIKLTKLEQEVADMLIEVSGNLNLNSQLIKAQFPVENPKGGKPFMLDFAVPFIKLAVESDGEIFHDSPDQQKTDQERDSLLAQRGWTVLRFDDKVIEDAPQAVKQTISSYMQKLINSQKQHKKASVNENNELEYAEYISAGECKLYTSNDGKIKELDEIDAYHKFYAGKTIYTVNIE